MNSGMALRRRAAADRDHVGAGHHDLARERVAQVDHAAQQLRVLVPRCRRTRWRCSTRSGSPPRTARDHAPKRAGTAPPGETSPRAAGRAARAAPSGGAGQPARPARTSSSEYAAASASASQRLPPRPARAPSTPRLSATKATASSDPRRPRPRPRSRARRRPRRAHAAADGSLDHRRHARARQGAAMPPRRAESRRQQAASTATDDEPAAGRAHRSARKVRSSLRWSANISFSSSGSAWS